MNSDILVIMQNRIDLNSEELKIVDEIGNTSLR